MQAILARVKKHLSHLNKNSKIAVALSGGIDSSVTAYILKELGYDVSTFYMQNWIEPNGQCHHEDDWKTAKLVSQQLDLPIDLLNFSEDYWQSVFSVMLDDYAKNITPNPDILCNREIKFSVLLEYIKKHGFDYLSTGHYAITSHHHDGHVDLLRAYDEHKDQTYFLCALNQSQLKHCAFPLGSLLKTEVRDIANHIGLINATRKESMGVCFVEPKHFKYFLQRYIPKTPGLIVNQDGHELGLHDGLPFYTIGQRQGLGIGGHKQLTGPWYVIGKNEKENKLIVSCQKDLHLHRINTFIVDDCHFTSSIPSSFSCECKLRHGYETYPAIVKKIDTKKVEVHLEEARSDLSPGQWCVFYLQKKCLGGGQIYIS